MVQACRSRHEWLPANKNRRLAIVAGALLRR
jgi:hypothetical protein